MRLRRHLTYANVMATIAVFGVVAGGGAYAASKIGTDQIKAHAVTSQKLDRYSVTRSKIAPGGVGEGQMDPATPGVALAGVNVDAGGGAYGSFNRTGTRGPVRVERLSQGAYAIYVDGLTGATFSSVIPVVTLINSDYWAGEASVQQTSCSGYCDPHFVVVTRDSAGDKADRAFSYVVFGGT